MEVLDAFRGTWKILHWNHSYTVCLILSTLKALNASFRPSFRVARHLIFHPVLQLGLRHQLPKFHQNHWSRHLRRVEALLHQAQQCRKFRGKRKLAEDFLHRSLALSTSFKRRYALDTQRMKT